MPGEPIRPGTRFPCGKRARRDGDHQPAPSQSPTICGACASLMMFAAEAPETPNDAATNTTTTSTRPLRPAAVSLLATDVTSSLEPEVLQRLRGAAVEHGRAAVVAAALGELALRDPGRSAMRCGRELVERVLGLREHGVGLVVVLLLEESAAEHEAGIADLVEAVLTPAEELERVARLARCCVVVAGTQMDLRQRRDRCGGLVLIVQLEGDAERLLEPHDRVLRLPEQEVDDAEVVQQPAHVLPVRKLFVLRLRALRVRAREHPVAVALGEQRRLEVHLAEGLRVLLRLGELERALDVLARRLVIALAAVAAGAPREDVGAEEVRRERRALRKLQSLAEQGEGGRDAREEVPADTEAEEDVRAVDVRELGTLRVAACLLEQLQRRPHLTGVGAGPGLAAEDTDVQLDGARAEDSRQRLRVVLDGRGVLLVRRQRVGAGDESLGARAAVGRDAARQEGRVHAEARGEPVDGLLRRPRLPPLDLGDVLLREPVAGEVRLRQPRRHAQLAQALAEARSARCRGGGRPPGGRSTQGWRSLTNT